MKKNIPPYTIPNYLDIQNISEGYIDENQFLGIVKIIKDFPDLHKFLVEVSGKPNFPTFNLITVLCADIVRYMSKLLENDKIKELTLLLNYLDEICVSGTRGEKDISGDFILSYLYLLGDNIVLVEELMPKNLAFVYNKYFK